MFYRCALFCNEMFDIYIAWDASSNRAVIGTASSYTVGIVVDIELRE